MHLAKVHTSLLTACVLSIAAIDASWAQSAPGGPPAVGVVEATKRPITESSEFLGRVQAINQVSVVARVTAFLEKRLFEEGAEVKNGDHLYRLERGPFEADLAAKKAQVAQLEATLENAKLTTERARILLSGPAGQQSTYDAALANQRSLEAQVQGAQAQVQASQINLDYTDIRSPIDGRIGRLSAGDRGQRRHSELGCADDDREPGPMYVVFPVPVRQGLELRARYTPQGGLGAVIIRLRLPDGRIYDQTGKLNFASTIPCRKYRRLCAARSIIQFCRSFAHGRSGARTDRWLRILYDDMRHLVTVPYSKENLHEAAQQLGIKRCWFDKDHYDIPKRMMSRMSETVAEKVSPREIAKIVRGK